MYRELYEGVAKLAERATRGSLGWKARLVEIAGGAPPIDPEMVGEIEQALREVPTCRFFTNTARDPAWARWLDGRRHLEALFRPGDLNERDRLLALWLAKHYAIEHFDEMFELVAVHGLQLNPFFWFAIGRELGVEEEKLIEGSTLQRWVTVMIASAPLRPDPHVFMWLAKRCHKHGLVVSALELFLQMSKHQFELKRGFSSQDVEHEEARARLDAECALVVDHWSLNEVWEKCVKPHLDEVAQPLLSGLTQQLESMQADLRSWSNDAPEWDSLSYGRSAIEPHEQDRYNEAVDVLIDAVRDTLEWFSSNSLPQLDAWVERLITSQAPVLRRAAIHATAAHPKKSPEDRFAWVLQHVGVRSLAEHHEVHRLAALNYPTAEEDSRRAFIFAVLATTLCDAADFSGEVRSGEVRSQRFHFDWLSWLLTAKPDCGIAEAALAPIRERFPEWRASEHPDLTHWMESGSWGGWVSPWSTEQLLSKSPSDQLEDLIAFEGCKFNGPSREGLLSAVKEAAKRNAEWGFDLASALQAGALWSSDLWAAVLRGLQDAAMDVAEWRRLLEMLSLDELHREHAHDIADSLLGLVKDGGKDFAAELLPNANAISQRLWVTLRGADDPEFNDDWLTRAINRPAGVLVNYWLESLVIALQGKEGLERVLPDYYLERFTSVVQDPSLRGAYGRALLASQTAYLYRLDEAWTREHILPLFQSADGRVFAQAWHGFLSRGRLNPALADALLPAFLEAIERADVDLPENRTRLRARFIELYTALCAYHVDDPIGQLLPALFQHGTLEDRTTFASTIQHVLRRMDANAIHILWKSWLGRYWLDRLQGVLAPLLPAESLNMLEWLPHLGDAFAEAVDLAIQMPPPPTDYIHFHLYLRGSDLVSRFPEATANLLIYLATFIVAHQVAELAQLAAEIQNLSDSLRDQLSEALVRAGAL